MKFRGLHDAVQQDDVEAINAFLDQGIDINIYDDTGWTPLQRAAHLRHMNAARTLFERGAHRTIHQQDYDYALNFAATSRNAEFVRLFLEKGVHLLTTDNLHLALRGAAWFSSHETMLPLLEHGAVITPDHLFTAASAHVSSDPKYLERHAQTVEFVLAHGIDINEKDRNKNTALILSRT